jgi:hypothetical protein
MKKKLVSDCYLEEHYKVPHDKIHKQYLSQYFMTALWPHQKICGFCILHLIDGSRLTLTDNDVESLKHWNKQHPFYAEVIAEMGVETVRLELKRKLFEIPQDKDEIKVESITLSKDFSGSCGSGKPPKNEVRVY